MNKLIVVILYLIIFSSCGKKQTHIVENIPLKSDVVDDNASLKWIGLEKFKFENLKHFDKFEDEPTGLKILTDTIVMKKLFGLTTPYFDCYSIFYYSKQKPIGDFLPLTFIKSGDDYGALVLVLYNKKTGKVVDRFELSGGSIPGPSELDNGGYVLTDKQFSYFINDSTIKNTKIHYYVDSLGENQVMRVDTVKYLVRIDRLKGLISKKIDSIRIETNSRYY